MFQRLLMVALAATIILTGCDATSHNNVGTWITKADTLPGGMVHVSHTPPSGYIPVSWILEEDLSIGTIDGAHATSFSTIVGLKVRTDGSIVVLDRQAQEIRIFDQDGNHVTTHGRSGNGPGEFNGANGLMLDSNDRLWVPDPGSRRMSVVDATSGFVTSYQYVPRFWGFIWSGVLLDNGNIRRPSSAGENRDPAYRTFDSQMQLLDSVVVGTREEFPPGEAPFSWRWGDDSRWGFVQVPLYDRQQEVLDPQGGIWTSGPGYRIRYWHPDGDTTLVITTDRPTIEVTSRQRDSIIASLLENTPELQGADWSKIPDVHPQILSMFLSDEGDLWVRVSTEDGTAMYDVYSHTGELLAVVGSDIDVWRWLSPVVRGEFFHAVTTDALDVPSVNRWAIREVGDETSTRRE